MPVASPGCPSCGQPLDTDSRFCKSCGSATPTPMPVQPASDASLPRIAGRWMLETRVASSDQSQVWKARDPALGRVVAVKIHRMRDPAALRRFHREAGLLSNVRHPNLAELIDVGETADGDAFMVFNWIEGPTLESVLNGSYNRNWMAAAQVGFAIAGALDAAHRRQILHQDVKPSNILLPAGRFSDATLIDFGVLGELDRADEKLGGLTMSGLVVGTPKYMSPEQLSGDALSKRADLYCLGLVLREMLWGPEEGSIATLFQRRMLSDLELPRDRAIPDALRETIAAMLHREPERRPEGAAVMDALRALMVTQRATTSVSIGDIEPMPATAAPKNPSARALPSRRAKVVAIAIGFVSVTLLAVIVASPVSTLPAPVPSTSVAQGVGLMLAGCLVGIIVSRLIEDRRSSLERNVSQALTGSRDRENLSRTMIVAVDAIIEQTAKLDAHFLGATIVGMVREYDAAKDSSDKQQALVRATELLEKLLEKTSPWYVRNSRWVVAGTALIGLASGAVKLASDFGAVFR